MTRMNEAANAEWRKYRFGIHWDSDFPGHLSFERRPFKFCCTEKLKLACMIPVNPFKSAHASARLLILRLYAILAPNGIPPGSLLASQALEKVYGFLGEANALQTWRACLNRRNLIPVNPFKSVWWQPRSIVHEPISVDGVLHQFAGPRSMTTGIVSVSTCNSGADRDESNGKL